MVEATGEMLAVNRSVEPKDISLNTQSVLVLGMHRSGTSALMRVLNLLGVELGSEMMVASPDNEKGYWEHVQVNKTNIEIMDVLGLGWSNISQPEAGWEDSPQILPLRIRLKQLLEREFGGMKLWGMKDPRISVLLPLYRKVMGEMGIAPFSVLALRNPVEVARSVSKRDGFALSYALMMWLRYTLEAEYASRGTQRVIVRYDEMLTDWVAAVRRIEMVLGLNFPIDIEAARPAVEGFLDAGLQHQRVDDEAVLASEDVPDIVRRAYAAMKMGWQADEAPFHAEMDALRAEAADPRPLYATVLRAVEADNKRLRDIFEDDRRKLPEERVRLIENLDRATAQSTKLEQQLEVARRELHETTLRLKGADEELSGYRFLSGQRVRPQWVMETTRKKTRVLVVSHNHPMIRPGGAEMYAWEMYQGLKKDSDIEPIFLAKGGAPLHNVRLAHPGTQIYSAGDDPNAYFLQTEPEDTNLLMGYATNKGLSTVAFKKFLEAMKPDVVHFNHTVFFGYEFLRVARQVLGDDVPILYTLHEYIPICHSDGQMVKPRTRELCYGSSPHKCHSCFPNISPQAFYLRKRYALSHFDAVDMFLSPSRFLMERYIDWGIPRHKIRHEENGRLKSDHVELNLPPRTGPRNRFTYFGQVNPYKGIDVLLEAMKIVGRETQRMPHAPMLKIHGANLDIQHSEFADKVRKLLSETTNNVKLVGPYRPNDQGALLDAADWAIVPSVWWENAPMVIQEAFIHKRPVIASDIGGMAEKVLHEVNGLQFKMGDRESLAAAIIRASSEDGLWQRLSDGIAEQHMMDAHVHELKTLYSTIRYAKKDRAAFRSQQSDADDAQAAQTDALNANRESAVAK